ncbi:sugar-binding protein [Gardnerella vaginalis]|uniref:sugar-binding protein n=1 Tax=Gardnerella vaginalis TaxID=2702 RepID=UPI0039EFB874
MRCDACRRNGAWGGVFVSTPLPAYADGYVAPDGNIYYGYKSDSNYSKERFKIEVHYYSNKEDADNDTLANQDPLGQYVHVKYTANLNDKHEFDKWAFRPMWWYGVPAGLTNVHNINYSRFEKYTKEGKPDTVPGTTNPGLKKDSENTTKHYRDSKDWKSISRFYVEDPSKLKSMNGLAMLLGVDGGKNNGYDPNGTNAGNWKDFYDASKGMQGMFIDWESAGKRFYEMDYVAELTDDAWKNRDEHPLRFAAGVYRFAGNWHIATGQIHRAPKIADSLKVQYPALTPVAKADALENTEKTSVENAIKKVNKDVKHFNDLLDKIEVANDGTATLTFHDNTTIKMPGKLLVVEDKKDNVKFPPVYPAPIGVVKPKNLSDADQKAIIKGFKDANKDKDFLKKVKDKDAEAYTFDNNKQELTINYKDGSSLTIPYDQLVYQGATISDWAPYVVPDPIEVANLTSLTTEEQGKVTAAFDEANKDLDVYTAAKKDSKTPVTFDKDFKNAIITWADGSTTEIPSWQFLKKKAAEQIPTPKPPTPTPTAEKEFIVEAPKNQSSVNFDPFNAKDTDLTDPNNTQSLNSIKDQLKKCVAKDAKDNKTPVTIKDVEFKIEDSKGVVVFHADNYKDAKYPMSVFLKQKADKQTPKETEHNPQGKPQYKYKVKPIQYDGDAPTPLQQIQALKDFVKSNYGIDISNDTSAAGGTYVLKKTDIPVQGTSGLQFYDKDSSDGAGVATIGLSTTSTDGSLTIQGYEKGDSNIKTLFTVPASELYVKKNSNIDHTLSDLKQQAKDLLKKRTDEGLTKDDLKRAGITNADTLNDNTINSMDEKVLRDLIAKLTDAKKAERKYNEPGVVEFDKGATDDAKFKAAVKAFLKANYTNPEVVTDESITSPLTLPGALTAKNDTVYMGIDADGIKSLSKDASNNIVVTPSKGDAFTVKVTYKQKEDKPTPSAEDLKKFKEQAKQQIDRNPKLTDEQKKQFKDKIDKADTDTKEKIQNILKEANEQAGKNNVNPNDIKKKENEEKEKREKEQKEKDKKEREKKQKQQLQDDKKKASDQIDNLNNLTPDEKNKLKEQINGTGTGQDPDGAKTPEDVQKILEKAKAINDAKGALQNDIAKGALPFLDHGNASDDKKGEASHADDVALHELLGGTSGKDQTLTDLENALKDSHATAESINNALAKAKLQNTSNEQNAKIAGIAKLDAKKAELDAAYNALTGDQKTKAKGKYDTAVNEINTAKGKVNSATKPSEIKNAVESVDTKIDAAKEGIKNNTPKRDTTGNTNDPDAKAFEKEKNDAKGEIDKIPGLSKEEKDKYKEQINQSTHKGDPEAIVNQAKKHTKIAEALEKIKEFKHLNDKQKEAFKKIIEDTDAYDHTNADGTTSDDIDDALANAANTDNAMARLEELKKKANDFKNEKDGKYSKLTNSDDDQNKKKAFDGYLADATTLTKADQGDAKNADQVNELYKDLLKAMRAIDPNAQSAGLKTDALKNEIDSDNKLKPDDKADPKTPGDSSYTTASKEKKEAFDKALNEAQTVLNGTKTADISDADKEAAEQKEIDAALDKLIKARLALDGVNTKPLQDEIDKDSNVKDLDKYKYADKSKTDAFDKALQDAKDLIDKLTGTKKAAAGEEDITTKTQAEKQKLVDDARAKLKAAEEALDGKKPVEPTPTPTPTPTPAAVDKTDLAAELSKADTFGRYLSYLISSSDKQDAYNAALAEARRVYGDPNATQEQVNAAAAALRRAAEALRGYFWLDDGTVSPTPSPLPLPDPLPNPGAGTGNAGTGNAGSGSESGYGVNDNAPTTVDKGELNIQIDSAESDLQPGNAGNGNAGNANAGNAGNATNNNAANANAGSNASNANNANGANSAAVNAAVESNQAVKQADAQVSKAQEAVNAALAEAKKVAADPNATQAQVDAAAQKLSAARKALAAAKAHAAQVRASVRAQVLRSSKESKESASLSATGSNVSAFGLFAATLSAAGAALFATKRRGISRHSNR